MKELDLREEKMRLQGRTKEKLLRGKVGIASDSVLSIVATLGFVRMVQKRNRKWSAKSTQSARRIWFHFPQTTLFPPPSNPPLTPTPA